MKKNWNELEFTNFADFKRMAPSIIQLEITRLEKIIRSLEASDYSHNLLVKARFDLIQFKEQIQNSSAKINDEKLEKLFSALFCISEASRDSDIMIKEKTTYILDRLNDLVNKSRMLY
jgi:hypothetical protein